MLWRFNRWKANPAEMEGESHVAQPDDRLDADPSDLAGQEAFYANWLSGLSEEVSFWSHYLKNAGGDFSSDFEFRLRRDTLVAERDDTLAKSCEQLELSTVKLLDVGAGPLTNLGKNLPGVKLDLLPCDPLADVYGWLLDESGVDAPVRTRFADAENLSHYFPPDSFDVVHCSNALDHSYDPSRGILEMLKVVSAHGFVQLGHWENEAEFEQYNGLHQWNFTEKNGDFIMWNRRTEIPLSGLLGRGVEIMLRRVSVRDANRDWILVQLRKTEGRSFATNIDDGNLRRKYEILLSRMPDGWRDQDQAESLGERYHALLGLLLRGEYERRAP